MPNFTEIRLDGFALIYEDGRTDRKAEGRTDGHIEGNRRFSRLCERA